MGRNVETASVDGSDVGRCVGLAVGEAVGCAVDGNGVETAAVGLVGAFVCKGTSVGEKVGEKNICGVFVRDKVGRWVAETEDGMSVEKAEDEGVAVV